MQAHCLVARLQHPAGVRQYPVGQVDAASDTPVQLVQADSWHAGTLAPAMLSPANSNAVANIIRFMMISDIDVPAADAANQASCIAGWIA